MTATGRIKCAVKHLNMSFMSEKYSFLWSYYHYQELRQKKDNFFFK